MTTTLERTIPVYHFHERHSRLIPAPPEAVWQSLTTVTLHGLSVTKPLLALRHLGGRNPPPDTPLLTDGPMTVLEMSAPRYAVGGAVAKPWQYGAKRHHITSLAEFAAFDEPGWVKYLTDFDLDPHAQGTLLTTETRGYSTDDHARWMFRLYWAAIRPGSGIVRRDLLHAIARDSRVGETTA